MKAPISVCLISRRDPHLDACLSSFDGYVEQIVVVCTDSDDQDTPQIASKHGATFLAFTDCNDAQGRINDFSLARNKALSLATQPWLMWIDSDDLMVGAENLLELTKTNTNGYEGCAYLLPYEYSYDPNGNCNCLHYRERLFTTAACFEFRQPVHEVLCPVPGKRVALVQSDKITIKHQRQYNPKPVESGRNLRILKNYFEQGGTDPRNMYYIGLEYANSGDFNNAIKYLTDYLTKSGWSDEKAMAMIKLVDIYHATSNLPQALNWAFELLKEKHNWFEAYYCLCKTYYFMNLMDKAAYYGQLAEKCDPTQTLLFVDTAARFHLHTYLSVALNATGKPQLAYESTLAGLKGLPQDINLLNNKKALERGLNINQTHTIVKGKKDQLGIVFVTQNWSEAWSPETAKVNGIGGSETMLIHQARELAALGHNVHVFAACEGVFDNVVYHKVVDFGNIDCDVLIVSRYAEFLGDDTIKAKLKLLWVHDVCAIGANAKLLMQADRILALSEWHKNNIMQVHNVPAEQVIVTRNGIDLTRFWGSTTVARNPYKCINSSSPDRSWVQLFKVWGEIKKQVPNAELHLFYGFTNWRAMAANNPGQLAIIAKLEEQAKTMPGIVFRDRVNQTQLAEEFRSAQCWLYPTNFTETSCITAMEAQAANCHIITSPVAALSETCEDYEQATLIEGDSFSAEYQAKFVAATVKALNTPIIASSLTAKRFDIPALAEEWNKTFRHLLDNSKPLLPYLPTPKYRKRRKPCELVKLNIACGPNVFPYDGWHNLDHADFKGYFNFVSTVPHSQGMPDHQRKLWEYVHQEGGEIRYNQHDMVNNDLPYSNDTVDLCYVGQAIEHINYQQAVNFLKDVYRALKPGGVLRMTTPDFTKLLLAYQTNTLSIFDEEQPEFYKTLSPAAQFASIMFGSAGTNQATYEGHQFIYTEESMTQLLNKVGFTDINFSHPGLSVSPVLQVEVVDFGFSHSMIVEAVK